MYVSYWLAVYLDRSGQGTPCFHDPSILGNMLGKCTCSYEGALPLRRRRGVPVVNDDACRSARTLDVDDAVPVLLDSASAQHICLFLDVQRGIDVLWARVVR